MTGAEFGGVDIDLLADYIGGVLTGTPEESVVAARIATDPAWREAYASLHDGMAFVSAELGRWTPEPMPDDLAARLDAALAATPVELDRNAERPEFLDLVARSADPAAWGPSHEPVTASAATLPVGDVTPAPTPHLSLVQGDLAAGDVSDPVRKKAPRAPRARRLRWAAPIAVAAGVLAFAGFGLNHLAGREDSDKASSGAASGASAKDLNGAAVTVGEMLETGTNYTHATLGTAPVKPMSSAFAASGSAPVPDSGQGEVPKVAPDTGRARAWGGLQRLSGSAALDACLAAIEQANAAGAISVESVDYARFAGAPAVIVRFSANNGHWAWASGADCGTPAGDAATLDKVPVG